MNKVELTAEDLLETAESIYTYTKDVDKSIKDHFPEIIKFYI